MIAFAKAELQGYDTSMVYRLLNVSRSGYYKVPGSGKRLVVRAIILAMLGIESKAKVQSGKEREFSVLLSEIH